MTDAVLSIAPNQFAGNNDALNVAAALVDLHALDVAVVALDGVFVGIAAIAVNQHRLRGSAHSGFGGEELGGGGGSGGGQALIFGPGCAIDQQPRRVQVGGHVGQISLNHLEISEALTELAALLW